MNHQFFNCETTDSNAEHMYALGYHVELIRKKHILNLVEGAVT